jgi:hypothetical protein
MRNAVCEASCTGAGLIALDWSSSAACLVGKGGDRETHFMYHGRHGFSVDTGTQGGEVVIACVIDKALASRGALLTRRLTGR